LSDFKVPDMRCRVAIGAGDNPPLYERTLGDTIGPQTQYISVAMLPAHSHTVARTLAAGGTQRGFSSNASTLTTENVNTSSVGNGASNPLRMEIPSTVLNYIIYAGQ